jgi:5-methylcytosine-specific restriction protein A
MPNDALLKTVEWARMRRYILLRDKHRCQIGGPRCKVYATEVDHIVGRADGGAMWDPANLRAACKPCNGGRSARRTTDGVRYRTEVASPEVRM